MWVTIFQNEWKMLIRSRILLGACGLVMLAGIYAIHYGYTEMNRQKETIQLIQKEEKNRLEKAASKLKNDTLASVVARQINKIAYNAPNEYAGLAIGQRDLHRYYYLLRPTALHLQIYQNEISNPLKLLSGNFDLSFVLVYLFPLLIVALSYNLLSQEQEQGTLALVLTNPISSGQLIGAKITFRFLLLVLLNGALLGLAVFWHQLPLNDKFFNWLIISNLYIIFWFALLYWLTTWRKSSAVNALSALGFWLLLVVVIPTFLNLYLETAHAIPSRFTLTNEIRDKYNISWDIPKEKVFKEFFATYPQYKTDTVENNFGKWLYANVAMVDRQVSPTAEDFLGKIKEREQLAHRLSWLSPATWAQAQFNQIAESDLANQMIFLNQVKAYHQQLKAFFYEKIYQNKLFGKSDFAKIPSF
ncbi:MAG: ABC transporter permease subunit [Microscillaceae bacterium]|jgi:ABC-2 type transport system permease protein|nr:ABC transporter permease subunit [Microscillaceae bacterium]